MGIISAVVGYYANVSAVESPSSYSSHINDTNHAKTNTPVPIFICAALYIVMGIVAAAFPFEPYGRRSS